MKTYIASPFFSALQSKQVEELESLLIALKDDFYSPRQHGNTSEIVVGEMIEPLKRALIFNDNIDAINNCGRMIVNLFGHKDIGTLFEYGYAIAKKKQIYVLRNGNDTATTQIKLEPSEIASGRQTYIQFDEGCDVFSMHKFLEKLNDRFISSGNIYLVDTNTKDSYPAGIMMLGYLYARGIPVAYISNFKSKSNLMITEAFIQQYESLDDFTNHKPVIYSKESIQ